MYKLILLCFLVLVPSSVLSHGDHDHDHEEEEVDPNSNVVVLGDNDFEETIKNNAYVFAEFYAPWCGHCKRLVPDYERLATHFKSAGSPVVIAKVDATVHNQVATQNGVRGYPTLKFFKNGKAIDYEGGRTADEMIKWITKKTSSPTSEISTAEKLKEFVASLGHKIVAYINKNHVDTFTSIANNEHLDDFQFAHVTDSSLFDGRGENTVVIHKPNEEDVVYNGEFSADGIAQWISQEGYPLFEELAQRIWQRSSTTGTPLLAVFVDQADKESGETILKGIAEKFKGKVLASISFSPQLAERWGSTGKVLPTAVFVNWKNNEPKLTVFDEEAGPLDVLAGVSFVENALKGEYKGFKKSEPVPESNDGPVKVLVGKTFDEIVLDSSKDVFVEFYAPWCGHCKNLAPIWDELGKAFSSVPTVTIAKLDATANSYPENLEIQGFPTLVFFPADDKTGVNYSGDRDLATLKEFVKKHASRAIEKEDL